MRKFLFACGGLEGPTYLAWVWVYARNTSPRQAAPSQRADAKLIPEYQECMQGTVTREVRGVSGVSL